MSKSVSISVVDHGACNIRSVVRSFEDGGATVSVVSTPDDILRAERLVLPGVGSFAATMKILRSTGVDQAIQKFALIKERPLLGVCLGMQLLANFSDEGGEEAGLGIIPGRVEKLEATKDERVPHVGWNEVFQSRAHPLFNQIPNDTDFYFVHSYHFQCSDDYVIGKTRYCNGVNSAIANNSVIAVQFHPEKSQGFGAKLLENFLAI